MNRDCVFAKRDLQRFSFANIFSICRDFLLQIFSRPVRSRVHPLQLDKCNLPMRVIKTASQMHVATQIAVHCWQYAPDVVSDMPQMQISKTASRWRCHRNFWILRSDWTTVVFWCNSKTATRWCCHWSFWILPFSCKSIIWYKIIEPAMFTSYFQYVGAFECMYRSYCSKAVSGWLDLRGTLF